MRNDVSIVDCPVDGMVRRQEWFPSLATGRPRPDRPLTRGSCTSLVTARAPLELVTTVTRRRRWYLYTYWYTRGKIVNRALSFSLSIKDLCALYFSSP